MAGISNILTSGAQTPTTTGGGGTAAVGAAGGGGDPTVTAIAQAASALFGFINSALQPGIASTRAYFEQLLQAKPSFQNPFASVNESRKNTNNILIYAGVAVILMLILAIIVKSRKK